MLECAYMSPLTYFRIHLLLLFTLLQCVAPLAHAHVDGHNSASNAHIATASDHVIIQYNQILAELDVAHISAHEHDSSVVCMPPEYRSHDLTLGQAIASGKQDLPVQSEFFIVQTCYSGLQAAPPSPYQLPCSQAPPA